MDLEKSLNFYQSALGLTEYHRTEHEQGRFTLVYLATGPKEPMVELTYNWDQKEPYTSGRNFGHLAFEVENIYDTCTQLQAKGIKVLRPPRDGRMAFIKSPDGISIELLQKGEALPRQEPWASMPSVGDW